MWEILQDRSFNASANSTTDLIHFSQFTHPAAKPVRAKTKSICKTQLIHIYHNWMSLFDADFKDH